MTANPESGEILAFLTEKVGEVMKQGPWCHGWDHTLRVLENARRIQEIEGGNRFVVECAAVLHDVGRGFEDRKGCHAETGAKHAGEILCEAGLRDEFLVGRIIECVRRHRYRRREELPPVTLEAMIVYDADKLDSLGAVGVGRAFHFAGRIGARVHNTAKEAIGGEEHGPEDTALREYLVKLRYLPGSLYTAEGRRRAKERAAYMKNFFVRFCKETGTGDTLPDFLEKG